MITIYTQSTHSKISYDKEDNEAKKLLLKSFIANNTSLQNDPRVKNGYMSSYENFYNEDNDILPTGLIPYVFEILKKNKFKYEHIELRKFPEVDKEFLNKLIHDEIIFIDKNGIERDPSKRPYQKESVLKVIETKGGNIKLPTSSGKTLISALITMAYKPHKILFVFDSIDLIHQTYKDFVEELNIDEKEIGIIQGSNYKYDKDTRIILLSMQSYEKAFHIFPQVKVICVDESHVTGRTETAMKIIYSCQNAPVHIGLSATPDRISNPAEQLRLYATIGPIVYEKEIIEQIDNKHISDIEVNLYKIFFPNDEMIQVTGSYNDIYEKTKLTKPVIKSEMRLIYPYTIKECDELLRKYYDEDLKVEEVDVAIESITSKWKDQNENNEVIKEGGDYFLRRFKEYGDESTHYIFNDIRNNKIAEIAKKNKRVLILFNKIKHGEELLKRLPNAILVHGSNSKDERDDAEKYLKENEDAIVIASKIWAKGKNIPEIENYINAGGGVSEIEQIQKMGRAVRLSSKTGKKMAYIHDFLDSYSPLSLKQSRIRERVYIKEKLNIKYE